MENFNYWVDIAIAVLTAVMTIALLVMAKKNIIGKDTFEMLSEALKSVKKGANGVETLYSYATFAVTAVEQLANAGVIKGSEQKKEKAMEFVEKLAAANGDTFEQGEAEAADILVETAVKEMKDMDKRSEV